MQLSPTNIQENTKDWWDQKYKNSESFLYSKEPSKFLLEHLDLIPKGAKVVELACGEGRNAVAMALKGLDVKAIDFAPTAIERAKQLADDSGAKVEWKGSDLDFFIPDLMSFDAMVLIDFRPPPTLIKNLIRGLKKDGLLIIESFLTPACIQNKSLEVFECFKPGELLKQLGGGVNYRAVFYSELGDDQKAYFIAKKTEMI